MTKKQIVTKETSLIKNPKENTLSKSEQLIWSIVYAISFSNDNISADDAIEQATLAIVELRKSQGKVNSKMFGENYLWLSQIIGKWK